MTDYEEEKQLITHSFFRPNEEYVHSLSLLEDILEYPKEEKKKKQKNRSIRYLLN